MRDESLEHSQTVAFPPVILGDNSDNFEHLLAGAAVGFAVFDHSLSLALLPPCHHAAQPEPIDVTGSGGPFYGKRKTGSGGVSRKPRDLAHAREVMGIDWMTRAELSEAIPPAYTGFIGEAFFEQHHVA